MRSSFAILLASVIAAGAVACASADIEETAGSAAGDEAVASTDEALVRQCSTNAQCGATSYCALDKCTAPGTCTARPVGCPTIYAPVCGCDKRTYSNACVAARAGVSVAHTGACVGVH